MPMSPRKSKQCSYRNNVYSGEDGPIGIMFQLRYLSFHLPCIPIVFRFAAALFLSIFQTSLLHVNLEQWMC